MYRGFQGGASCHAVVVAEELKATSCSVCKEWFDPLLSPGWCLNKYDFQGVEMWSQCVLAALCLAMLSRFAGGSDGYLTFFTDDFYYYQQVAENLVLRGVSSFDGVHQTNGYHPLWLLLIAGLSAVLGRGLMFFVGVTLLLALLVCVAHRHYRIWLANWFPGWPSDAGAWMAVAMFAVLARTGMEVALAACLLAVLLVRVTRHPLGQQGPLALLGTGVLASLVVLSRLDAIIPIALMFAFNVPHFAQSTRPWWRAGCLVLGCGLIAGYLLLNWTVFQEWLPISGHAKQLKAVHGFSWKPLARLFGPDALNVFFVWPAILLGGWALRHVQVSQSSPEIRVSAWAVFAHPFVFFALLSWRSDWPTWTWYLYPLPPLLGLGVSAVMCRATTFGLPWLWGRLAVSAWVGVAVVGMVKPNAETRVMHDSAVDVAKFAREHPGIYAAGDRAGLLGYLMPGRVYQMEGLVGDRQLLDNIRASRNLKSVLGEMGADYYVHGSSEFKTMGACFRLKEPALAGPDSPAMTAFFCERPVAEFRHGKLRTLIFKVTRPAARG